MTPDTGKTCLVTTQPWGLNVRKGTRVLCSDGKIRSVSRIAQTADTFFSIPASVKVNGKTISGYVCFEEQGWIRGEKESDFKRAVAFRHHNGQDAYLPAWPNKVQEDKQFNALIAIAHT